MSDQEKDLLEENEEDLVVVITDEEGNEFYYREEMIIPVGDQKFALLVSVHDCEDEECDCEDEDDAILAKIVIGEDGKEEYIDPTDEEFEAARKAYEKILEEEDDEE